MGGYNLKQDRVDLILKVLFEQGFEGGEGVSYIEEGVSYIAT